ALPAGALAGFAVGIAAAARLRDHRVRAEADAPPAADLPRAPANGPIRDALGFGWVGLVVIAALLLGLGAVVAVALRGWWPLAAGLPVVVVLTGMMRFDVEADETGVRVRNLGMTSVDIGIEEITGAQVVHVTPFKDYGGWGLRLRRPGSYGIVTRTGPATRIDTASGLTLAITTDKAEELAGALNAWADLRRGVA
ncbi:MAG: DUF1648 domain-containing protein, partial [Mycobacteriaceae bacterium]|nr:DUF1648 domain-containing protein [Mycobacteriaceae bacterium]